MSTNDQVLPATAPKKTKKLKPARKQVKPGDVVKSETPQTGKEYSMSPYLPSFVNIHINTIQISGTISGLVVTEKTVTQSKALPSIIFCVYVYVFVAK